MVRKMVVWMGALALVCALPVVAFAGPWTVSAGGGAAIPTGDFGDKDMLDAQTGFQFGGAVDYRVNQMFAVGLDGSWNRNTHGGEGETEDFGGGVTYTLDEGKFNTWQVGAHGMYFIPTGGNIAPYLMAGVGIYNTKLKWEETFTSGGSTTTDSGEDTTDSRFGFKGGVGGIFTINEMLGIGVEGNYNFITQDSDKVSVDNLQYLGVTAMLVFNLMQ